MFRAVPLPIIMSFPLYIRHWYLSSNLYVICYDARSRARKRRQESKQEILVPVFMDSPAC
jgi:hypothetical protein